MKLLTLGLIDISPVFKRNMIFHLRWLSSSSVTCLKRYAECTDSSERSSIPCNFFKSHAIEKARWRVKDTLLRMGIISPPSANKSNSRKKVVILGTGWGFAAFAPRLDIYKHDICVISPHKAFYFTPLLTHIISGRLPNRVCEEPIETFTFRGKHEVMKHILGNAIEIDGGNKQIVYMDESTKSTHKLPYDYLVINVGSANATFIPGIKEYALYLRNVEDSLKIRAAVLSQIDEVFKEWNTLEDDQKRRKLSFIVAGGGPTGVEVAGAFAELVKSLLEEEKYGHLQPFISIKLIEMSPKLLPTTGDNIPEYAKYILGNKAKVKLLLRTKLLKVGPDSVQVQYQDKTEENIPYGVFVWASGASPSELTKHICETIPEQSKNPRAINVDEKLRVIGLQYVYALGDCALVTPKKLSSSWESIFQKAQKHSYGPSVDYLRHIMLSSEFPQLVNLPFVKDLPENSKTLTAEEFRDLLIKVDELYHPPPPTAQGASQQGRYLAGIFNNYLTEAEKQRCDAFLYNWRGSSCYIYDDNIAFYSPYFSLLGGLHTKLFWQIIYASMEPSWGAMYTLVKAWLSYAFKFPQYFPKSQCTSRLSD
ncbi:NADH dehydrogenase, putative [Cryptosporidium muris RN66]|uniref:NADH:ubiquinone reductase (non-electrogenic) n=1 Tax=Cryptosporidium muris (strain RN66) TaxID=441375 RepID=B6AFL7_CRYMR|nr:NADH dehydrogenase, putative [Cryptosporidium muris RN66]EEA07008.1 NADH dehydrogenase, putative [Cryptosporidium muris RN66]|eukprot:XP_002141357.1 NADH dehydrogenase [Cryptosporidium muris RN66]